MATERRYFWLKLKEDFFTSKWIKKLRNMAGGDTYLIIFLKLQLLAMKSEGTIPFDHLEDTMADELALDLDESADNVRAVLAFLLSCGLAETDNEASDIYMPCAMENVGCESSAASRMRKMRQRNNVTPLLRGRYGEIEIEKDIDQDIDQDRDRDKGDGGDGGDPDKQEKISRDRNEILNAADTAGFPKNQWTKNSIVDLFMKYGKENVMAGIAACVRQSVIKISYLQRCCENLAAGIGKPKAWNQSSPPGRKWERDNSGAQEEAMEQMREMIRASRTERSETA